MFSYQVRPRVFKYEPGEELCFPADCTIRFHFLPDQPFGVTAAGGHTAVHAAAASVTFNANTGEHTVESKRPLTPLDVTINQPNRVVRLEGKLLSISQRFVSLQELESMIMSIFFGVPTLLNIKFADPPFIERVDGLIAGRAFRWELSRWLMEFMVTTQEEQEQHVADAWKRLGIVSERHRRRLMAGLHYFHLACRLAREGRIPGEFVAEVVLNLAKTLEVLFPPERGGHSRDAVRKGLRTLEFSEDEVEGNFLPAIALRNEIDVGHVELGLFSMDQLKVIHAFTERAETAFRNMLDRLLKRIEEGKDDIASYELGAPRKEAIALIERLRKYTPEGAI